MQNQLGEYKDKPHCQNKQLCKPSSDLGKALCSDFSDSWEHWPKKHLCLNMTRSWLSSGLLLQLWKLLCKLMSNVNTWKLSRKAKHSFTRFEEFSRRKCACVKYQVATWRTAPNKPVLQEFTTCFSHSNHCSNISFKFETSKGEGYRMLCLTKLGVAWCKKKKKC